jgi:serine protease SohB
MGRMKRWIPFVKSDPRVAVIRLGGVITSSTRPGSGISDQAIAPMLERAFKRGKPQAVAISLNSPGGSPVQSSLVAARIRRLAKEAKIPVYVFVEDLAASGGYWIACAGDEIWIDQTSIVGSIGVISASFGLQDFIARHGVERRVHTAGKSKSFLDPFKPEKPEDIERLKAIHGPMHQIFIDHVKGSRGDKLSQDVDLFTGEFWVGQIAVDLGLADGLGHLVPKMKERFGDKVKFSVYDQKRRFFQRIGMTMMSDAYALIEERAAFARHGL